MKSSYELAMERLNADNPNDDLPLTDQQKEELADLENKYKAKLAEKRIAAEKQISDANAKGDFQTVMKAQEELKIDISRIESDRDAAKDRVRQGTQQGA